MRCAALDGRSVGIHLAEREQEEEDKVAHEVLVAVEWSAKQTIQPSKQQTNVTQNTSSFS